MRSARRKQWRDIFLSALVATLYDISESLYVQNSRSNRIEIAARDICYESDIEFARWNHSQTEITHDIYKRVPTTLRQDFELGLIGGETSEKRDASVGAKHARSLSNIGDLTQMQQLFYKLVRGDPVVIAVLGGSVSLGHGPIRASNAFFTRVFAWINGTFPNPQHRLLMLAIPAITSSYVSPCALTLLPENPDLVILEFTYNDSERGARELESDALRSVERMLRRIATLPSRPAILWYHYWSARQGMPWTQTCEDAVNKILNFYGWMGISMRDGLRQEYLSNRENIMQYFWPPEVSEDRVHPSCIGSRFMADHLISLFQDFAAVEILRQLRSRSPPHQPFSWQQPLDLGPPLQKDNWGNLTETCILDPLQFKSLVHVREGFKWIDEGKSGKSAKWGFIGQAPGDQLDVHIPVSGINPSGGLTIGLGFLTSYENVGLALLECVSGCECIPREYSFWHPYGISIVGWRILEVKRQENSPTCSVRVTIQDRSKSTPPSFKVKVTSVMITEERGFLMPWLFCDDCIGFGGTQ